MKQLINGVEIDEFTYGYLEAAFWTEEERLQEDAKEHGIPLKCDPKHFPDVIGFINAEDLKQVAEECKDFQSNSGGDLKLYADAFADYREEYGPEEKAGHDFWLTRNHHGAGFWDRGLGELGDRLTAACRIYGGSDLYLTDDGEFAFS